MWHVVTAKWNGRNRTPSPPTVLLSVTAQCVTREANLVAQRNPQTQPSRSETVLSPFPGWSPAPTTRPTRNSHLEKEVPLDLPPAIYRATTALPDLTADCSANARALPPGVHCRPVCEVPADCDDGPVAAGNRRRLALRSRLPQGLEVRERLLVGQQIPGQLLVSRRHVTRLDAQFLEHEFRASGIAIVL